MTKTRTCPAKYQVLACCRASADYQISKLARAARAGSTPAQLTQFAIELGLTREAADHLVNGYNPDAPQKEE